MCGETFISAEFTTNMINVVNSNAKKLVRKVMNIYSTNESTMNYLLNATSLARPDDKILDFLFGHFLTEYPHRGCLLEINEHKTKWVGQHYHPID